MKTSLLVLIAAVASASWGLHAATLEPIRQSCGISAGTKTGTLRLRASSSGCSDHKNCGTELSDVPANRFTGISLAELAQQGTHRTAVLAAEAGTFTCSGTVSNGELSGEAVFTPDAAFVARMERMGFSGYDSEKLLAYALLDVQSGWAHSLKEIGIHGLDADKLIPLRVFNVDLAYVHSMTALGYALPNAEGLISMRVQGVNAEEVGQIRALGYQPTLDQLVQIRIFKITPEFIQHMQARGFKNLSIEKLVQIRIFNLAD